MGLFSQDKTTTESTDNRLAGTDQAIVQRQGGTVGGTAPIALGGANTGNIIAAGATQLQGSNQVSGGSVFLQGGSKLELHQTSDPLIVENALKAVTDSTGKFTGTLKDLFELQSAQQDNQRDNVSALISGQADSEQNFLDKFSSVITGLAQNSQTGGDAGRNKIVLYVVLALLAVTAVIFWRQK